MSFLNPRFVLCFSLCMAMTLFAKAQDIREYTTQEIKQLVHIKYSLLVLDSLQAKKVISEALASREKNALMAQASHLLKISDKAKLTKTLMLIDEPEGKSLFTRIKGFFSFVNIMTILSAVLLVVALGGLVQMYLLDILQRIPLFVYEILIYLVCFGTIYSSFWVHYDIRVYVALLGCLGFVGALAFTGSIHKIFESMGENTTNRVHLLNFYHVLVLLLWGSLAYLFPSTLLGFMSVAVLYSLLGFSIFFYPSVIVVGFKNEDAVTTNLLTGFILLVAYITLHIQGLLGLPYFAPFACGIAFISCFAYYIALLISSNYSYVGKYNNTYFVMQAITIASGVLALYIGNTENIPLLRGIGGTFFVLYLLEKYYELPWDKIGWIWSLLGLAGILYATSLVVRLYPHYFFMG
ncbi:MAG: hypothetical protein EAZ95_02835 [Bacteroidetes bacterium]|nr:MAG: hypothetical protein EAZ95_02835 [Bacteroidota bacterium]